MSTSASFCRRRAGKIKIDKRNWAFTRMRSSDLRRSEFQRWADPANQGHNILASLTDIESLLNCIFLNFPAGHVWLYTRVKCASTCLSACREMGTIGSGLPVVMITRLLWCVVRCSNVNNAEMTAWIASLQRFSRGLVTWADPVSGGRSNIRSIICIWATGGTPSIFWRRKHIRAITRWTDRCAGSFDDDDDVMRCDVGDGGSKTI